MFTFVYAGIEFKDFILGFCQSTFLCATLKCIEKFRIPFIKSGIPASNLGFTEARNPLKFAACVCINRIPDSSLHNMNFSHSITNKVNLQQKELVRQEASNLAFV